MQAWTLDASGEKISNLGVRPFCCEAIGDFFDADLGRRERILVAPKGYGKTLFLKYKSYLIRKKHVPGIPIFPRDDIEFLKLSLDWSESYKYVRKFSVDRWSMLWQFVLIGKGVRLAGIQDFHDGYLDALFGKEEKAIGDLLSEAIQDSDNFGQNTSTRLRWLREAFNDSRRDAVIFIENADEMFQGLDRQSQLREGRDVERGQRTVRRAPQAPPRQNPSMWHSAQIGLMLAVREIERSTPLLSVYTTLRAEAVLAAKHPDALQARTYTLPIRYSRQDLQDIFAWHVDLMPVDRLAKPSAARAIDRFLGPEPINHRHLNEGGRVIVEDAFELILRHTNYSPRDLVTLGLKMTQIGKAVRSTPGRERSESIRHAIDAGVAELNTYLRENFVPLWDASMEVHTGELLRPVLGRTRLNGALPGDVARALYIVGMLGVAEKTEKPGVFQQRFLTQWDDAYASPNLPLPQCPYYFLHPWLLHSVRSRNPKFRDTANCLLGNGHLYARPILPRLTIGIDSSSRPILYGDDILDSPGDDDARVFPAAATFIFAALLACHSKKKNFVTRKEVAGGLEEFKKRYPRYRSVIITDPFNNTDHRHGIGVGIKNWLPSLYERLESMEGQIAWGFLPGMEEETVTFKFVDPEHLRLEDDPDEDG